MFSYREALPEVRIVRQPVSWVVGSGGSFRMSCKAVATPAHTALHYQWFKNNTAIPNETASELRWYAESLHVLYMYMYM